MLFRSRMTRSAQGYPDQLHPDSPRGHAPPCYPDQLHPDSPREHALQCYPDFLKEKHTALVNITLRMIAYLIRICLSGWKTLTKASKPCYFIPKAYHSSRSAALQWCVRTPCLDIFAMDSKELSSISDCLVIKKLSKHQNLTQFD